MAIAWTFLLATMALFNRAMGTSGPLLLSPYLENNNIQMARAMSRVQSDDIPASHAGFITANKTLGNHLFFWFFPLPANQSAPLLLWLNGGPGTSSLLGLLWENGPVQALPGPTLTPRNVTWSKYYSIVYVDNPVGVGFSYSASGQDGYRTMQDGYGEDLHSFVKQFFQMFPEYKSREFYVGGQSYAGRYAPVLAMRLHEDLQRGIRDVPLTGIFLGSPYFDSPKMMSPYFEYLYSLGAIDFALKKKYQGLATALYRDSQNGRNDHLTLSQITRVVVPFVGLGSNDNYVTGEGADADSIFRLVTSPRLRNLLKVGNISYHIYNDDLFDLFSKDFFIPTTDKLAVLMNNYKVLIYSGVYDVIVSPIMVDETLMQMTAWDKLPDFSETERTVWKDNSNGNGILGFYSKTGQFCRVIIHRAGHQAPHDQPETTLRMIREFTEHGCIRDKN